MRIRAPGPRAAVPAPSVRLLAARPPAARLLAAGLLASVLGGCGDPPAPPVDPQLTVAAEAVSGELTLEVAGQIDNRAPVALGPRLDWMPFASAVPDGARVAVGDELVVHDITMLRQWIAEEQQQLGELTAEQEGNALELAQTLDGLEQTIAEATADRAVRAARLDADRSDEAVQRRLADLELAQARRALERDGRHAADAQALADAGRTPRTDAAAAATIRDRARRRVAAAEEELAQWDGDGTRALARRGLEIAVERSRRELEGLASDQQRLANARAMGATMLVLARGELDRVADELARRQAFAADPVLRSTAAGTVRLKDPGVRAGAKLPATPCLFVLEDAETVAYVRIPEALRDLCTVASAARPADGQATVRVPAAGIETPARVISIGATAEARPDGSRAFLAVLRLDLPVERLATLKPGMRLAAELVVAARPVAALPAWAVHIVDDPREPLVRGADGAVRRVHGMRIDGRFVATDGLAPGDRVVALAADDGDAAGKPVAAVTRRRTRLTGILEPFNAVPVRLTTGGWDVVEVVPDGGQVRRGQVVARLSKNAWWVEPDKIRWNRDAGAAQADAERTRARLDADRQLLDKAKAWRDADLDRAEARIAWLAEGAADSAKRWEDAEAARVEAAAAAVEAEARSTLAQDPRARPALSANEVADARLAALRQRTAADRAALDAAAARWPDLLAGLGKETAFLVSLDKAEDAGADWLVARLQHGQSTDRAELAWRRRGRDLAREGRELDDEEVYAPADGRMFHRNPLPWRPGDNVGTNEPFRVVPDPPPGGTAHRRLRLEVPAHRAGEWKVGDPLPVVVPGVGSFPGLVIQVGTWYGTSAAGRLEADDGGASTAVDEQIFNLVVDVALGAADADRVLPGMTAYVE